MLDKYQNGELSKLIAYCNGSSVLSCMVHINNLSHAAKMNLRDKCRKNPDGRYGDNLLLALSGLKNDGTFDLA